MNMIHARVGLQQRILPEYRVAFFDRLATACLQGLSVFAGEPCPGEAVETAEVLTIANLAHARNLHLGSGSTYMYWQLGVLPWLYRWQPRALIMEINPRNLSNPTAARWMRLRGRPVIGWGLGIPRAGTVSTLLHRNLLRHMQAVIAYSETGAEQYIKAGMDPARVFVAANAVTPRPAAPPIERPAFYPDGFPRLLFVGRLQARKRVDTLLHALAALPMAIKPQLTIVGDGPDRARLEQLAWQVYPQAYFVGARHGADLEPYFAAADLFILPGTGGLAIQQAMAHSLPVIVGQADGTQAELVRSENGWLLADESQHTLTETIQQALADLPALRRKGLASYRVVAQEVNIEAMVETFTRAVESVL
jgi:glycosyltransferase involved in cell wall biosynthesis